MKKFVPILSVGCLSLLLNSCGLFSSSEQAQNTPPPPARVTPPPPPKPVFQPTPLANSVAGNFSLIPSTSPFQRRQDIQKGRPDPFAILPVQPVISIRKAPNGVAIESLCKVDAKSQSAATPTPEASPQTVTTYIEIPAPPVPNEARAVLVSGVVKTSRAIIAIVKAPSESVARQVTAGTTLSNGLIRVKAIDTTSAVPVVILEQYGRVIARAVGQKPDAPLPQPPPKRIPVTQAAPAASAPIIPPPPAGPNGFGRVRDVVLLTLNVGDANLGDPTAGRSRYSATGIICNAGTRAVTVSELRLQVQDKKNGTVLDSFTVELGDSYELQSGQKAEFDGGIPKFRGRQQGEVNIILRGWK